MGRSRGARRVALTRGRWCVPATGRGSVARAERGVCRPAAMGVVSLGLHCASDESKTAQHLDVAGVH